MSAEFYGWPDTQLRGDLTANGNFTVGAITIRPRVGLLATINAQTGTAYTLEAGDNCSILTFSNGAAITLTVDNRLPPGFSCLVVQLGAGVVTFAAASDTTILQADALTSTAGQYAIATLLCVAPGVVILSGNLQ